MSLDRYRRAVVTGGSRGIGAAIVRCLRSNNIEVHVVARPSAELDTIVRETGSISVPLDISDRSAVVSALGNLEADILVNNAALPARTATAWETDPAEIDALLAVNLRGTLNCLAALVPGMKARGRGHIVTLGSTGGTWVLPGMPIYAMTKAGLHHLVPSLRADLHGSGIRVSEISPGRVETGMHLRTSDDPDAARQQFYEGFETLQPEDVADAILFVLSAPQRMDVTFMEIVPTDQTYGGSQFHRRG